MNAIGRCEMFRCMIPLRQLAALCAGQHRDCEDWEVGSGQQRLQQCLIMTDHAFDRSCRKQVGVVAYEPSPHITLGRKIKLQVKMSGVYAMNSSRDLGAGNCERMCWNILDGEHDLEQRRPA